MLVLQGCMYVLRAKLTLLVYFFGTFPFGKIHFGKLLVKAFRKITRPVVYGHSVTVQRHRHSDILKV